MFAEDIRKSAKENNNFRKVIFTGKHSQIVVMSIPIGGDIGLETHDDTDQLLFFVSGEGEAIIKGEARIVGENDIVFVPAGSEHNFQNIGETDLKLFTVYSPPEHPDGTVQATKNEK